MRMQPIVDGLKEQYGDQMAFISVDARGDGEAAFKQTRLLGHPAFLIVQPDGKILWRGVGEQSALALDEAVQKALQLLNKTE